MSALNVDASFRASQWVTVPVGATCVIATLAFGSFAFGYPVDMGEVVRGFSGLGSIFGSLITFIEIRYSRNSYRINRLLSELTELFLQSPPNIINYYRARWGEQRDFISLSELLEDLENYPDLGGSRHFQDYLRNDPAKMEAWRVRLKELEARLGDTLDLLDPLDDGDLTASSDLQRKVSAALKVLSTLEPSTN